MPKLTFDPITGAPVLLAPERSLRPNSRFSGAASSPVRCPFCPGHESDTPPEVMRVGTRDSWDMRVVPNRYPAVTGDGDGGIRGVHEVIVETPLHEVSPYDFDLARLDSLLQVYDARVSAAVERGFPHAVVFKNSGEAAGETLSHAHSQLIALESDPTDRRENSTCQVCPLFDRNVITASGDVVAVAPSGSRFPYEVLITARAHGSTIDTSDTAHVLHRVLRAIDVHLARPAFNLFTIDWGIGPHAAITVVPRLTSVAGFELATGMWINVIEPERTARELAAAIEEPER